VRWIVLITIAFMLGLLHYSWTAQWISGPDLLLALAAWAMVDGTEDGMVMRAWVIGLIADMIDPGSECFHALMFLGLAVIYLPLRSVIFRTHVTSWAAWAFICTMLSALIDGWISGIGDARGLVLLVSALWTAVAAMVIGGLFRGLPVPLHPIGKGGA
jgi:hypothetical protein